MTLIHDHIHSKNPSAKRVFLKIDRLHLEKRRWRGIAEDGSEFGFDLAHPLQDGDQFFENDNTLYVIEQLAEAVIEIPIPNEPAAAARVGWLLGNLHFKIELLDGFLRINDDLAIRQLLEREHIPHEFKEAAFHPISGGHSHAH
ncbi:MAG: urease accessory protein UreE [Verrucomicrobiota bacterium]